MKKHCPVCGHEYEHDPKYDGMVVDCPKCWEGRTIGPMIEPDDFIPITKCLMCGKEIHAGEYGAYWGRCPECETKLMLDKKERSSRR